jgi:hypothetical protein
MELFAGSELSDGKRALDVRRRLEASGKRECGWVGERGRVTPVQVASSQKYSSRFDFFLVNIVQIHFSAFSQKTKQLKNLFLFWLVVEAHQTAQ